MNGTGDSEEVVRAVTAWLPGGVAVKVEAVTDGVPAGGMASVGLRHFDVADALESTGETGALVVSRPGRAGPSRVTAGLRPGFAAGSGKLTALWVGGRGRAALTVTLGWPGRVGGGPGSGPDPGPGDGPAAGDADG